MRDEGPGHSPTLCCRVQCGCGGDGGQRKGIEREHLDRWVLPCQEESREEPGQGRGPCSASAPASPRLTSVQCPDSRPRLPCSIKGCWAEGVAFSWIWDVFPGSIWASLGSQGRELQSYWQRRDSESCSRSGHNSGLHWS